MEKEKINSDYKKNIHLIDTALNISASFDLVKRELIIAERDASLYFVDGFIKDDIMTRILIWLMEQKKTSNMETDIWTNSNIPYVEVEINKDLSKIVIAVLSGSLVFIIDGMDAGIIIDARTYPVRSIVEPENERVLRGPREGFVETIVFNTAMIRRHIRHSGLTMNMKSVGNVSKTDIVICYMNDRADMELVNNIGSQIDNINVEALSMGHMSFAECLIKSHWYNPFPKIRYTERPDTAAACIMEGSVLLICDGTPVTMILPTSIFDFLQEADDFYLPPITGTYLRITRFSIFITTLFLTPVWFLLISNPEYMPTWLEFIKIKEMGAVPILAQLFLIEFAIDGLKLASLNTPSSLSNSLSVVGALILGEFAVKTGWFVPEVILYMAFVSIANFTQPSFELGYAFKFMRVLLLLTTAIGGMSGFLAGIVIICIIIVSNKTVGGYRRYLYPLIPFNLTAIRRLVFCERKKW